MVTVAILGLGGRGGHAYGDFIADNSDKIRAVAIADLKEDMLLQAKNKLKVPSEYCFHSDEELFAKGKLADACLICTQDKDHYKHAIRALKLGYHLLLEKPISPSIQECLDIQRVAKEMNRVVVVCHVLRYNDFFSAVKELADQKKIGEIIQYTQEENIGYYHYAHSYVRGNWRREEETSPMILAKSCHDMDMIIYITGKTPKKISSFGKLNHFNREQCPVGATKYCLGGCKVKENCPFDAEKIYAVPMQGLPEEFVDNIWPSNVVCAHPTYENIMSEIKAGPYGRCVYQSDNDVVDNQVVSIEFTDGTNALLRVSAFSNIIFREVRILGTKGEIKGNDIEGTLTVQLFGQDEEVLDVDNLNSGGHGGGDGGLMNDFIKIIENAGNQSSRSAIDKSIISHIMAHAAEKSRHNYEIVDMDEYIKTL